MRPTQFIPQLKEIARPKCAKCGSQMWLAQIEPHEELGRDRRTFECPRCQEEMVEVVKYR